MRRHRRSARRVPHLRALPIRRRSLPGSLGGSPRRLLGRRPLLTVPPWRGRLEIEDRSVELERLLGGRGRRGRSVRHCCRLSLGGGPLHLQLERGLLLLARHSAGGVKVVVGDSWATSSGGWRSLLAVGDVPVLGEAPTVQKGLLGAVPTGKSGMSLAGRGAVAVREAVHPLAGDPVLVSHRRRALLARSSRRAGSVGGDRSTLLLLLGGDLLLLLRGQLLAGWDLHPWVRKGYSLAHRARSAHGSDQANRTWSRSARNLSKGSWRRRSRSNEDDRRRLLGRLLGCSFRREQMGRIRSEDGVVDVVQQSRSNADMSARAKKRKSSDSTRRSTRISPPSV